MRRKVMTHPRYKTVKCPECEREVVVELKVGERELLDGYHGECPGPHCGYWHFEDLNEIGEKDEKRSKNKKNPVQGVLQEWLEGL